MTISLAFGRREEFDARSLAFPIRALFSGSAKPRSFTWSVKAWLDQGQEGACVGFAWAHEAVARPSVRKADNETARGIYKRAQALDQWAGEDYEGTSVLAGAKASAEKGWFSEYRWASGVEDLALALGFKGPAVLGLDWFEEMATPNEQGFLRPRGAILGGHAVLCNAFSLKKGFHIHNSWGQSWGANGGAWISHQDMAFLLASNGEACIPSKRKRETR